MIDLFFAESAARRCSERPRVAIPYSHLITSVDVQRRASDTFGRAQQVLLTFLARLPPSQVYPLPSWTAIATPLPLELAWTPGTC